MDLWKEDHKDKRLTDEKHGEGLLCNWYNCGPKCLKHWCGNVHKPNDQDRL